MKIDSCMWYSTLITSAEKKKKLGMGQVKQMKTFTDTTKRTLIFLQSFGRKNVKIFPVHTGLLSRYTEAFPHTSVVR